MSRKCIPLIPAAVALFILSARAPAGTIHVAAEQGDTAKVEQLLQRRPDLARAKDGEGMTPLHYAAYAGHLDTARLLIEKGADVSAAKNNGSTPLHGASLHGKVEAVRLLLDSGADVNLQNEAGYSPLLSAVAGGQAEVVNLLLAKGADVGATLVDGATALHRAVYGETQSLEIVKLLLANGADPNAKNPHGVTPLFMATWGEGPEIVSALIAGGADVNDGPQGGRTPLMVAVSHGNEDVVKLLTEKGAEVDAQAEDGATPLTLAVTKGFASTVEVLLSRGASVDKKDEHLGRTPLHLAAIKGYRDVAALLLAKSAKIDATDAVGRTALHLAARYGHRDVAELLRAHGATPGEDTGDYDASPHLKKELNEKQAVLWYLGHCGWAIKTANHLLIFDYWNEYRDPSEPSLANGLIAPDELAGQKVTVFVSHEHRDHFDPEILSWKESLKDITYVFGFRPEQLPENRESGYRGPAYEYVGPRETRSLAGLEIRALRANDAGVGFLVKADGLTIYHAGDHAGWQEGERQGYTGEIDFLAEHIEDLDLAFLNVTGCHAHGEEPLKEGTLYTLEKLRPKIMIPTHAGDRERIYKQAAQEAAQMDLKTKMHCPENRGDRFSYDAGQVR
ncbi:MAG: ankyrin repeat domain-containing protein [Phycisphaerales bacterium]|nr:MAG: ankyrin repeat domain-containing protein [Phycisphaerales bacterium]